MSDPTADELIRMTQKCGDLAAEVARLRAALEAAPSPFSSDGSYFDWHNTTRREALDG